MVATLERPDRYVARQRVDEFLWRPFDPVEAAKYDAENWAKKNVEAAARQRMGSVVDPKTGMEVADPHEVVPYTEQ